MTKYDSSNIKVLKGEFDESLLKKNSYNTVLILERNTAYLDFKTEGNNGLFKIILSSNFRVKGTKIKAISIVVVLYVRLIAADWDPASEIE